jgi:hypothetical protein
MSNLLTLTNAGITTKNIAAETILTTGTVTVSNISYGYTTLPTLSSTSLGYTINYTNAITTINADAYVNSSIISVPIGVYIVQAYANFTPSSSSQYNLRLGINTVAGVFNNTYNYTADVNPASTSLKSIHYTTYLTVNTASSFYFVFYSSVAGNLNGSLNGKFIRIA